MNNHTSDTETSISNDNPIEEFKKDSIYPDTDTFQAQNNTIIQTPIEEA